MAGRKRPFLFTLGWRGWLGHTNQTKTMLADAGTGTEVSEMIARQDYPKSNAFIHCWSHEHTVMAHIDVRNFKC